MIEMSRRAGRPINWNVLVVDSAEPERYRGQLEAGAEAERRGAKVVALTMPTLVGMNMSFLTFCALFQLPGLGPGPQRCPCPSAWQRLRDTETRIIMENRANSPEAGVFARLTGWGRYRIGDTYSAANEGLKGRLVADIARERGVRDFFALLDIVLADDLRTVLWPGPTDDDAESWRLRVDAWRSPHAMLGGSDAGAHLDRMCGAPYTTEFLGDCLRGQAAHRPGGGHPPPDRRAGPAVRATRPRPAGRGLDRRRGRCSTPRPIDAGEVEMVHDLPGGAGRLYAAAKGIEKVFVNGQLAVDGGGRPESWPGRSCARAATPRRSGSVVG